MEQRNTYTRFQRQEWQKTVGKATRLWKKEIRHTTPGGIQWEPIRIIALVLFIAVTLFTAFKAALHAIPVADDMYAGLIENVKVTNSQFALVPTPDAFRAITVVILAIISELGMVYFMLLSYEVVPKAIRGGGVLRSAGNLLDLSVLMSYMPRAVTYLMVGFIFYISNAGGDKLTVYDKFLPVFVGIGLTYFVEGLAKDWRTFAEKLRIRYQGMWDDEEFIIILHDIIAENLVVLRRKVGGKWTTPNAWLETSDRLEDAVLLEYRRNTVNRQFAETVRDVDAEQRQAAAATGAHDEAGMRIPPNEAPRWTAASLWEDLTLMKARKPLQRAHIRKWYATGRGADTAWADIADKWNAN